MATLEAKLIDRAKQRCVAYYHVCTNYDDWGTMPEHWTQVEVDNPAPGYLNRYFLRVKNGELCANHKDRLGLVDKTPGVMCVTFLQGEITDVEWYMKPYGEHKHPEENYIHRDDESMKEPTNKPEGYGEWA